MQEHSHLNLKPMLNLSHHSLYLVSQGTRLSLESKHRNVSIPQYGTP